MNRSALKKYAPQARLDFIEAVTLRARRLGLDPALPVNIEQTGDVLLIGGQPFPASIGKQRATLSQRIHKQGFSAVVEALAYTWFNRLVAIRFMELKGYLSHGYRVLSHPQGQQPEILDNIQHLDLFGLDKAAVIRLKTAGNQDEVLYREILLAQCHDLHCNMPFLFEALDDATELLLPDNLLRTDSPIARLVNDIEEDDWKEVEVIGWLYQFYISEKKEEVLGKVVQSEDIPAATQLFTPNWIVQYLVQNSLGRLWMMANPGSSLKNKMLYYIESAEQDDDVQVQLDEIIHIRMDEDGGTLNPESLTILDPACGSGHILVEAYNLLRTIYEERGYRLRDIPRLILQKNLYGLDIDNRAAQLAGFALLMKAREDDRRLFDDQDNPPILNIMAVQESKDLPDEEIALAIINAAIQIEGGGAFHTDQLFGGEQLATLHSSGITAFDLRELIQLFANGKTFGSLINVPEALEGKLVRIIAILTSVLNEGDELSRSYASQILDAFARPASFLAQKYDAVVANPPYMGAKGMNNILKNFAKNEFPASKADIFAMFIERGLRYGKSSSILSMVTMTSWMFLSSFEGLRSKIIRDCALLGGVDLGSRAFTEISGQKVQVVAFSALKKPIGNMRPLFIRAHAGSEIDKKAVILSGGNRFSLYSNSDYTEVPGSRFAYWISPAQAETFKSEEFLESVLSPRQGMATSNNEVFLRFWWEVDQSRLLRGAENAHEALISRCKWFPYNKGGAAKRWFGNNEHVVNWGDGGRDLLAFATSLYGSPTRTIKNIPFYFREGITWGDITFKNKFGEDTFAARYSPVGSIFDVKGSSGFPAQENLLSLLGLLNSKVLRSYMSMLNPSSTFQVGDIKSVPYVIGPEARTKLDALVRKAVDVSREDYSSLEYAPEFDGRIFNSSGGGKLEEFVKDLVNIGLKRREELKAVEESINKILIGEYGLAGEISEVVDDSEITLSNFSELDFPRRMVSFAVGCVMGRYNPFNSGLDYANSGNVGFDSSSPRDFSVDADGILPITDESWFEDDAAERVREFVKVVWGANTLVENMEWLANGLDRKAGESVDQVIRRYLSTGFYKDHLQTYKKRPIYWLFSSGKQKAFECLVYLHRYNDGTLSRMRMEYVVPLQSRMQARIDTLADDINSATGSAQQKVLQKRKDKFTKQLEELRRFDETLRSYADQRIALDLDDGVKVNYGKFGGLLAEVKAITGGKED
ncbi:BREX-1 system adenine-specific DNA-methyltransferase PglX [Pseudomonas sp. WS 5021]|uniref:BREX-1 system adenine-specific DNA-methyltransferase PglX n=1 Tax=Pseudomonas sp. WS 5021 TaxID=2717490 RepID=UPI00147342C9|nr:BREX-1 system adenine-specific DNA-methyltransferase PglX [Pseudomonas sp. WS 5021]NMY25071.1 BREX-1 system adenine-specific DNA-methyltransferase PglX [Pseudomonas sp. WS 5021]